MSKANITLDKQSLAVLGCANKVKTRYAMNGVLVDERGFTATNGKILTHITHGPEADKAEMDKIKATVLAVDSCKSVIKNIGRTKSAKPFIMTLDTTNTDSHPVAKRDGAEIVMNRVEGHFPPYKEILGDKGAKAGERTEVILDCSLLIDVLKTAVAFGGKNTAATFTIFNDNSQSMVRIDVKDPKGSGKELIGVIMPRAYL